MELPGGGKEKGETPEQAAERELLKKTKYKGDIKKLLKHMNMHIPQLIVIAV